MKNDTFQTSFSPMEKIGFIAIISAALLFFLNPYLAIIPLTCFIILCFTAPFITNVGLFLPIISRAQPNEEGVALTFDDGPLPESTPILLDLLNQYDLQATFFVVGAKAAKYPELIADILSHGHTIGNHSWSHDYFLMLRSQKNIQEDIRKTQQALSQFGIQPCVFRPPAGITGPRLKKVLEQESLITVTYSCRALDRGNRNINNLAEKILNNLQPGDIIMLHDLPLSTQDQSDKWIKELNKLYQTLKDNYVMKSLSQIIQHPVVRVQRK